MTEKINLKIGYRKMNHFKLLLLLVTALNAACNNQNIRSDTNNQSNLIELQQFANTAYENELWADVIKYYTKLANHMPNDAKVWYRIGNAYAYLNQTKSAINAYQNALTISPNNSMILHNMGITQLKESTKTFIKVKENTDDDDPLNIRAQLVINAISSLLYKEFKIGTEK